MQQPQPAKRPETKKIPRISVRLAPTTLFILAACAVILIMGYFMQYNIYRNGLLDRGENAAKTVVAEISPITAIRINEVMTNNKSAARDENGIYFDWIELYNAGSETINLKGWILVDKASGSKRFVFPNHPLAPGECTLVYAAKWLQNAEGTQYHAPFKLNKNGDALLLFDADEHLVESINVPALNSNQSYARYEGGWRIVSEYTPGMPNTAENHLLLTDRSAPEGNRLYITEFMADNTKTLRSADGLYYDWIELYNAGDAPISLRGYALTDDPAEPEKWLFPESAIQPGGTLIVFASGLTKPIEGELHAGFRLRAERGQLQLTDPNQKILSDIPYDNLKADHAVYRRADGSYSVTSQPSPGAANPQ